jgi:hypothetical protein
MAFGATPSALIGLVMSSGLRLTLAGVAGDIEDRAKIYPQSGRFYVVRRERANDGVGCLKRITSSVAEIQRMYVQREAWW